MARKYFLCKTLIILLSVVIIPPTLSQNYKSKEDCLEKNSSGTDKEMINLFCDSIVYPLTEKEKQERFKRQLQREKEIERTYEENLQKAREEKQKELEKDPEYIKKQAEENKLLRCQYIKSEIKRRYKEVYGEPMPSYLSVKNEMPYECWDLKGL